MTPAERQRHDAEVKLQEHLEMLGEEGLPLPNLEPRRDAAGNRYGFMDVTGDVHKDNMMIQVLLDAGAKSVTSEGEDAKNKRFRILWDEDVLKARHQKIIDDHERSRMRKSTPRPGVAIQETDQTVSRGDIRDLDQYMTPA